MASLQQNAMAMGLAPNDYDRAKAEAIMLARERAVMSLEILKLPSETTVSGLLSLREESVSSIAAYLQVLK